MRRIVKMSRIWNSCQTSGIVVTEIAGEPRYVLKVLKTRMGRSACRITLDGRLDKPLPWFSAGLQYTI